MIDVRTAEEFGAGHIPGARNVSIAADDFEQSVAVLDRSRPYLVHCTANVPNGRSARALEVMTKLGFRDLHSLVGGFRAWSEAGGAVDP